jgi:hypothetical protein
MDYLKWIESLPTVNELDIDKVSIPCLKKKNESEASDLGFEIQYYNDDEIEQSILYDDGLLYFKSTDWKPNGDLDKDIVKFLNKLVKKYPGIDYENKNHSISNTNFVIDKNGFDSYISDGFAEQLLKKQKYDVVFQITVEENEFIVDIDGIRLYDYESPFSKLLDKLENIESILDIPNNLGSIDGWCKIMEKNGFVRENKCV